MSFSRKLLLLPSATFILILFFSPATASDCAVCFGAPDSPMAKAVSWSVIALLGIVLIVLTAFATFFVFIARRARENGPLRAAQSTTEALNQ